MASFSTLTDDFSAGSLNGSIWTTSGDGVSIVSGTAHINTTSNFFFSTLSTQTTYDLSNTSLFVQVAAVPTPDSFPPQASFGAGGFQLSSFSEFMWSYDYTAGAWQASDPNSSVGHAPAGAAKWLRIRNTGGTGGTVYWEYSTDGLNWVTTFSESIPVPVTALYANFYNDEGNSNGTFIIDNVNVAPPPPQSSGGLLLFADYLI